MQLLVDKVQAAVFLNHRKEFVILTHENIRRFYVSKMLCKDVHGHKKKEGKNMIFADKIIMHRKRLGLSQEQLAQQLGVTRQSVSKWEAGASIPELSKMVVLSELFQVSIDYLVKDYLEEDERYLSKEHNADPKADTEKLEEKIDALIRYQRGYEYTSRRKIKGIPLVSIRFKNHGMVVAKGIIAIGNGAIGVVSIGGISIGVISLGGISGGIFALGAVAVGIVAFGGVAIGILAIGASAIGIYAAGAVALGKEAAVGSAAVGKVAAGREVSGIYELKWQPGMGKDIAQKFILEKLPQIWKPLAKLLSFFFT